MSENVVVIGAGTAGLIAARELSSKGINTTVYDQKRVLGYPVTASGIISINGLKSIGVDYEQAITNTLYGANIHSGKKVMRIEAKAPMAHVLDRQRLNELCYEQAVTAGATIILQRRINQEQMKGFSADKDIVIGADGAVSAVARHYGMGELRDYVLTYKAEFDREVQDPRKVELFFYEEYKGLFGWLCPNSNNVLEAGIGIKPGKLNSKKAFESFVKRKEIEDIVGGAKMSVGHASLIPMKLRKKIVDIDKKVLLVGDAAGQVKPSTGGGIVFGGNAAILAAKTIYRHIEYGKSLSEYSSFYRKKYMIDTAAHSVLNRVYSGAGSRGMGFGIKVMNFMGIGSLLGKYGDMDSPTRMLRNIVLGRENQQHRPDAKRKY